MEKIMEKENYYKIAVLVCGQLREFNIGVKSWGPLFDLNCDFYFSTWNKSSQSKKKWPNYFDNNEIEITKNMITDIIPSAIVSVLNEEEHKHIYKITDKQILHWKNTLKICMDSNIKYDVIIVTRPDVFIHLPDLKNYINNLKENEIRNTSFGGLSNFFEDVFFMGNFNTIKTFIENLKESEINFVHEDLYTHLISLNLFLNSFPHDLKATEVRPITNELYRNNIDYDTIKLSNSEFILKYGEQN